MATHMHRFRPNSPINTTHVVVDFVPHTTRRRGAQALFQPPTGWSRRRWWWRWWRRRQCPGRYRTGRRACGQARTHSGMQSPAPQMQRSTLHTAVRPRWSDLCSIRPWAPLQELRRCHNVYWWCTWCPSDLELGLLLPTHQVHIPSDSVGCVTALCPYVLRHVTSSAWQTYAIREIRSISRIESPRVSLWGRIFELIRPAHC